MFKRTAAYRAAPMNFTLHALRHLESQHFIVSRQQSFPCGGFERAETRKGPYITQYTRLSREVRKLIVF